MIEVAFCVIVVGDRRADELGCEDNQSLCF